MLNKLKPGSIRTAGNYEALQDSIQNQETELVSVDVFDTLLLRDTKPEMVRFSEIADLWKDLLGKEYTGSARQLFNLRLVSSRLAYRHARKVRYCREAAYSDIMRSLLRGSGLPEAVSDALWSAEMEYEKQALKPNRALVDMLDRFRQSGKRVIAISDMYLSSEDIEALIQTHLPGDLIQTVYSSADFGYGKSSGILYESVQRAEAIDNTDYWVHCGDNYHSDVFKAREFGINAIYLPRSLSWRTIAKARNKIAALRLSVNHL